MLDSVAGMWRITRIQNSVYSDLDPDFDLCNACYQKEENKHPVS
jgi:hypothetical protein